MPNVVYARIHVLGMIDVAGIVVFLALGQYLFAVLYLVLAPFLAHAMANAYFYGEDEYNALYAADMAVDDADDVEDDDAADSEEENADETVSENLDSGDESND